MASKAAQVILKLAFFVSILEFISTDGPYIRTTMRLTRLICLDQPYPIAKVEKCELKLFRNKPSLANLAVRYGRVEKMLASVEFFVKTVNYRPVFPKMIIDVCSLLDGTEEGKNPIISYVFTVFRTHASHLMSQPCPIEGLYDSRDFIVPDNFTLSLLPPGNYYLAVRAYDERNRTGLYFHVYGSIRQNGLLG